MKIFVPQAGDTLTLAKPWTYASNERWHYYLLLKHLNTLTDASKSARHTYPVGAQFVVLGIYVNRSHARLTKLCALMGQRRVHIWVDMPNFNQMEVA